MASPFQPTIQIGMAMATPDRVPALSELLGDERRGRRDEADAEDQEREVEVGPQRPGGERVRAEPAHEDDVGGHKRVLRHVRQDQRPA
jgi:hypothetical protein